MPDITMPQLGETVTEGTVIRWMKKMGDEVAYDEPLAGYDRLFVNDPFGNRIELMQPKAP